MMFRYLPLFCCFLALLLTLQDSAGDSVKNFKLKVKTEDGKDHEEEVEIDTDKQTETFHVPKSSDNKEKADIVIDFKKNLMMILQGRKCYLIESTENVPKPADMVQLLKNQGGVAVAKNRPELKFKTKGSLENKDRSRLNEEMLKLCKRLPIYLFVKVDKAPTDLDEPMDQTPAKRTKRRSCFRHCRDEKTGKKSCFLFLCSLEYEKRCYNCCRG